MKTVWAFMALMLSSWIVGIGRLAIPGHDASLAGTYEAIAHVWCGFLLCFGIFPPDFKDMDGDLGTKMLRWGSLGLLLALTVFEFIMFVTR